MPNGQPRRTLDASRAEELFGFRARDAAARGHRANRRLVPGAARVSEQAIPHGVSAVSAAASRLHDALVSHLRRVLAVLVVAQIAGDGCVFASVERKGWLVYQGGDQIWLYTTGWMLGHGRLIPTAVVSYGWPLVMAPFALVGGATFVSTLPAIDRLNVLVLAPIALLAVFDIGQRIGGRIFGIWCSVLWIWRRSSRSRSSSAATTTPGSTSSCPRPSASRSSRTTPRW